MSEREMGQSFSPDKTAKWMQQAVAAHQSGRRDEAEDLYRKVLAKNKKHVHALHYLGLLRAEQGHAQDALHLLDQAIRIQPRSADIHGNRGRILASLKQYDEALASFDAALSIDKDNLNALHNRASTLLLLRRPVDALDTFDRILKIQPGHILTLHNRGIALSDLGRFEDALANWQRLLTLDPQNPDALFKRGFTLVAMRRYDEALADYEKALKVRPRFAEIYASRGDIFSQLKQFEAAVADYERALEINPDLAVAWLGLGNACQDTRKYDLAFQAFDKAFTLNPALPFVEGNRLHAKMHMCDWTGLNAEIERLHTHVREGRLVSTPFPLMTTSSSPAEQLECARHFAAAQYPASADAAWTPVSRTHDRIRIGYMSGEFREQATSYLTADLFECHDKSRFDIVGFSTGHNDHSPMRRRLEAAFGTFHDLAGQSSDRIADLIRSSEIDILINLNGYFGIERTDVFRLRPAPIQVNYLGFPGTMGADYIDYILADRVVIPPEDQCHYTEKVVYLPDCYQSNDRKKAIDTGFPMRSEAGLPDKGFVFCCFNNANKFTPDMFDVWMRILAQVDGSVLWLLEANAFVKKNLLSEAGKRGIAAERLLFAPRLPLSDHLSRLRLADLFLDTLPVNAHTTASDALWAGVPVLTCIGPTFAGRVAASLLTAVGLPDLITESWSAYERLAVALAKDETRLAELRTRLAQNRDTHPLFDTPRFTRHIEAACRQMWERQLQGQAPAAFAVEPIA